MARVYAGSREYRAVAIITAIISVVLLVGSAWLIAYVVNNNTLFPPPPPPSGSYTNYRTEPSVINAQTGQGYLSQESLAAMNKYIQENPNPQNVKVLTGMTTAQIASYMVVQVAGGLKVDCAYCHNINNFADESNPKKDVARQMLGMVADLNQNWIASLPADAGGKQITCATCHNGKPVFATYPPNQSPIPQNWVLPLDDLDSLIVTGEENPDLGEIQQNQYTMNHMNYSLGVGCAFCHNARYFPSYEIPQKGYALTMLNMNKHIKDNYTGIMNGKLPSCWMCHQQNYLPPGSISQTDQSAKPVSVSPN